MNSNQLLIGVTLLLALFVAGCGEKVDIPISNVGLAVGDSVHIAVPFSGWFNDFKNAEIVSKCSGLVVNSSKVASKSSDILQSSGIVEADVVLNEYIAQVDECLIFNSADYSTQIGKIILPQRQASFTSITFDKAPRVNNKYVMDFVVAIDEKYRSEKNKLKIKFSTNSPNITVEGKDINLFTLNTETGSDQGTWTPKAIIQIVGTGDVSRTVKVRIDLLVTDGGRELKIDSQEITRIVTSQ